MIELPPQELWLPSKPAIILKATPDLLVPAMLPGTVPVVRPSGVIPFSYEYIDAPEVSFTTTTLSTSLDIGSTPVAGRLIVVTAGVNRSGACTVTGVTFNGVAGAFVQILGTNTTAWMAWGVVETGTTCTFETTVNAAPVRTSFLGTYVLYGAAETPTVTPSGVAGGAGGNLSLSFTATEETVMISVARTGTIDMSGDLIEDYDLVSSGADQQGGASLQAGAGTYDSLAYGSLVRTIIGRGWVAA